MKLAAKQLLALGVPPQQITTLDYEAALREISLRELVQSIVREWVEANRRETL